MSLCSFNFKLCAPPPLINVWLFRFLFYKNSLSGAFKDEMQRFCAAEK